MSTINYISTMNVFSDVAGLKTNDIVIVENIVVGIFTVMPFRCAYLK